MSSPVLVITGASRGIGKACALHAILGCNARVVAVARNAELLNQLKQEVADKGKQDNILLVAGDVTDAKVVDQIVDDAVSKWGQINSVIANAGVLEPIASVATGSIEQWKRAFDINFFSIIALVQKSLPHVRKTRGSFILVSSGAATTGYRAWGAYGSSKAALNHLAATLGNEEPDVTTIAIRPGVVDTGMQELIRQEGKESMQDEHQKFVDLYESGNLIKPEDTGRVFVNVAINPPRNLSGAYHSWDDQELKDYR
ncbi:NAD(P)-binding protein [Lichtheimia hyalospora FSU 10163]|nr:NAD(P)-binding protein [Lichtheimia hyalospora FSU 10163]